MSALDEHDTLEEIRNMSPLDKLVRKYMWGHHINGTWFFHNDPKIDEARDELSDLRSRIAELEKAVEEAESYTRKQLADKTASNWMACHIIDEMKQWLRKYRKEQK